MVKQGGKTLTVKSQNSHTKEFLLKKRKRK